MKRRTPTRTDHLPTTLLDRTTPHTNRHSADVTVALSLVALLLAGASPVVAQSLAESAEAAVAAETDAAATQEAPDVYDRVWRFADWYRSESNRIVQSVAFSGRFQLDYAIADADQGYHNEFNVRRLRLGTKTVLFRNFLLHSEVEINPQEGNPVYQRFTDMNLQWSRDPRLRLTIGKHAAPFTADGSTSSKELLTIDRSNLTNNIWFTQEYFPGLSASGKVAPWIYQAGVYSAGGRNREFGDFDGSVFGLGVIGYDFSDRLQADEAVLAANYVYQNPNLNNTFTRSLEQVLSINFKLDTGAWGIRTDVSTATGYFDQSDLWGLMAMPFVSLTDEIQLVGRYTYLESDGINGVRLARYENQFVSGRGDRFNEGYVGVNYYFYGHKLKLQTGVSFADMRDRANDGGEYSGIGWTTGFRMGW